jgi:hypothetical protein
MKKNEKGGTQSKHENRNDHNISVRKKTGGRSLSERLNIAGKVIFKWI